MNYVVSYDISDDKRRKQLSDILEGYGIRVNYSLFEININEIKLKNLLLKIYEIIDEKDDSVRFYHICKSCENKSFEMCKRVGIFEKRFSNFFL